MIDLPRVFVGQNQSVTTLSIETGGVFMNSFPVESSSYPVDRKESRVASEHSVCRVQKIQDTGSFEKLQLEWNRLLHDSKSDCLFLSWEWLFTWWKHLSAGRQLHILTVRCGTELLGIAPLAIRPWQPQRLVPFKMLEFIGTGSVGSDYLDLIIRRGSEDIVIQALSEYLSDSRLMLEFSQLKTAGTSAGELAKNLISREWRSDRMINSVCPYIELEKMTWDSYEANLGTSHRRNLRKRIRGLYRDFDVRLITASNEDERRLNFKIFLDLHNQRWDGQGGSDAITGSNLVAFHDEFSRIALELGWLRLRIMYLNDRPVTAVYGFRYEDVFYYYQAGFDPSFSGKSVGLASLGLSIKEAIEEGAVEYDLLHGNEGYKLLWAREQRELCRVSLYPPNIFGLAYRGNMKLRDTVRSVRNRMRRFIPDRQNQRGLNGDGAQRA